MNTWIYERTITIRTEVRSIWLNYLSFQRFHIVRQDILACQLCGHEFSNQDILHLAFTNKANVIICTGCADQAQQAGVSVAEPNETAGRQMVH